MSNQDMKFADPGKQQLDQSQAQYQPQPINSDPREQQPGPSQGYAGPGYRGTNNDEGEWQDPLLARQMHGAKLRPDERPRQRRRRRHWLRPIVTIIVILALLSFLTSPLTGLFGVRLGWSSTGMTRIFHVGQQQAHVIINDKAGNIHIHAGSDDRVEIAATIEHSPFTGAPDVSWQQPDQGTMTVDVGNASGLNLFNSSQVDFDVTVPVNANLDIHTDLGNIDVHNVAGQVTMTSNAGNITATDTHLTGQGSLTTNAGSVNFSGLIDAGAEYSMTTNAGSVDVALLVGGPVHVTASTNAGDIHSDFTGISIDNNGIGKRAEGDTSTNTDTGATLNLSTNAGSITIRQLQS